MSQLLVSGEIVMLPSSPTGMAGTASDSLNAANETFAFIGQVLLENPLSGSKTISSAGGGSIVWTAGTVTFANGATTFDIGIQDVSTATSIAQPDGTFDVKASFTGGGGGVTANAVNTSVMTTGTKTIAHGDLIAITLAMTTRGGTDSIIVILNHMSNYWQDSLLPGVVNNSSGTWARNASAIPNAYIIFDDGTIGWLAGTSFTKTSPTVLNYNSGTATADEYGNLLNYPVTFNALGIVLTGYAVNASADFELLLYSTPLGTPVVERTITVDATQLTAVNSRLRGLFLFSTPFLLKANTGYAITLRPTTTNNIGIYYHDVNNSTGGKAGSPNSYCYAVRRLDNTGAFSDYNGGTAKTRAMSIFVFGTHIAQGVNMCSGQVGVY